ncbi:pyridoxamine 5'-phosphate oxidase family protein [Paraclostridium ghonii]|uniref:Nitroimidazol reductase NimA-like FMN-containing flavoprotein (Pyridoxamine 5'-phosphate oxidase superfamily) n=1 Tax=Paraclostridium ghonii TaxID=29358 RepID=A0ABU0MY04_9FIRM|nr:pyridoxamine 5'-phosphate oxidase family protein [Paeniclostridium ghonii]MDQ0555797.1 nitroimidazol reductase NimA-like FMN-containing flavoprotein (pyridoxamine 5'-phosphate oxidase superfamily) [Paeniclostridium ghonii]
MFKQMRRKERETENVEALDILKNGEYGVLSTIGENRYAYGVPLSYVYSNESIYFHCALEGQKLDNINYNNKVSFCVIGKTCVTPEKFSTKYESAIVFGKASEVFEEEKSEALLQLLKKYSPDFIEKGKMYIKNASDKTKVIKIKIDKISGKAN